MTNFFSHQICLHWFRRCIRGNLRLGWPLESELNFQFYVRLHFLLPKIDLSGREVSSELEKVPIVNFPAKHGHKSKTSTQKIFSECGEQAKSTML